jgi:hypothetical protein
MTLDTIHSIKCLGWLAQPAERVVHTDEVTGSSPVPPTKPSTTNIHAQETSRYPLRHLQEGARFVVCAILRLTLVAWRMLTLAEKRSGSSCFRYTAGHAPVACTAYDLLCCSRLFHSRVPIGMKLSIQTLNDLDGNSGCMESQTLVSIECIGAARQRF